MARCITVLFTIIIAILFGFSTDAKAQGYAGIEMYADCDWFAYMGKDLNPSMKIDVFVNSGSELACTVGPKLGIFNLGFGASLGKINDEIKVSYLDADLACNTKLLNTDLSVYTLYRLSRDQHAENKLISRWWLTPTSWKIGLIGDNCWLGGSDPVLLWGPYINLGKINGGNTNHKLAVTFTDGLWGVWVMEF